MGGAGAREGEGGGQGGRLTPAVHPALVMGHAAVLFFFNGDCMK